MKLLLHACCADCALKFLESAKNEDLEATIFYYNPNIHPRAEYLTRLLALRKVVEKKAKIIVPDWKPREYFECINLSPTPFFNKTGAIKEQRCVKCWNLRLEATAKYAADKDFDAFSSTLVTSEYQDQEKIEKIAENLAKKYKIKFWKPKEMCCDLKTSGFYKQFFCGCVYSLKERYEEKYRGETHPTLP
ncbi:MAG TPA: epoxyqueuosine reductase QueH [Candidatus Methanoperedens sp.]|nr:epoxyqueuosine reductase QueH [Candidatus Methanoperedens sp.]